MMDIISNELRRARKAHKCNFCGGDIEKGQSYRDEVFSDSGRLWTWKSHIVCGNFCAEHVEDNGDGIDQDTFCDTVQDMARERGLDTDRDTYELVKEMMNAQAE